MSSPEPSEAVSESRIRHMIHTGAFRIFAPFARDSLCVDVAAPPRLFCCAATLSRRRGMRRQLQTATDSRPETTSSWRWSSRCISRASSHDSARKQDMKPAEYTETRSSSSSKQVSKAHLQPASSQPTNQRRAAPRISRRRRGSKPPCRGTSKPPASSQTQAQACSPADGFQPPRQLQPRATLASEATTRPRGPKTQHAAAEVWGLGGAP